MTSAEMQRAAGEREMYRTIVCLREFANADGPDDEKVWITRAEARAVTDLLWHLIEKAKEEDDV